MQKAIIINVFFILFVTAIPHSLADISQNYQEQRIHNAKIEARLQRWIHIAKSHAGVLETSTHEQIVHWRTQMQHLDYENELVELYKLNTLINQDVTYVSDYHHYHKKDVWADPVTTLEEGGDCEDIALLKAASLYRLRWPENRMHLLVGYLVEKGEPESHAVLLVENFKGEQFILRSITNQVISPDVFRFIPLYAVDGTGTIIVKPAK